MQNSHNGRFAWPETGILVPYTGGRAALCQLKCVSGRVLFSLVRQDLSELPELTAPHVGC